MTATNTDLLAKLDAYVEAVSSFQTDNSQANVDRANTLRADFLSALRTAATQEAENARLTALLKPFADAADRVDRERAKAGLEGVDDHRFCATAIPYGDLRRARAALTTQEKP